MCHQQCHPHFPGVNGWVELHIILVEVPVGCHFQLEVVGNHRQSTAGSSLLQNKENQHFKWFTEQWKFIFAILFYKMKKTWMQGILSTFKKKMSTTLFTCCCFLKTVQHSMVTILIHSRASLKNLAKISISTYHLFLIYFHQGLMILFNT